jgi:Protein of unknown function (DUF3631)
MAREYATTVQAHVAGAAIVQVPDSFPEKWDLADGLPAGMVHADLVGLLKNATAVTPAPASAPQATPGKKSKATEKAEAKANAAELRARFSGRGAPETGDVRALLNAGNRKGATAGRCIAGGDGGVRTEELPAYCAVAVAGLRDLPDTLASRSIFLEMRRRAPDEKVEPLRDRIHRKQAEPIRDDLAAWCASIEKAVGHLSQDAGKRYRQGR